MTSSWMFACVVPALLHSPGFANGAPFPAATFAPELQATRQPTEAPLSEEQLVSEIIARSFPNLVGIDIRLKRFQSDADYFRTSFSAARFIAGVKMRYFVLVNPEWRSRGAPVEGVQAILAHELAHVDDLTRGKRIRLFGLMGLVSKTRTARFERRADLIAVARDYGSGLKAYRAWLFNHVPPEKLAEKQRDYFSPEEIDAILAGTAEHPELFDYWLRHVPMSLTDIQSVR
jgi:hypothetical protein